ncbi:beta-microseminoprotein [Acanthopagrus latus]|uniref:beta-microseminoprotein n=1 Tax=Acanthopagrus latus TaxID=8177 RepID=UPI00187C6F29|nr:beta-microseminoprotein [Acanthopagrus latus]
MASLPVFVCLLALVVQCHSDCFFKELVIKDLKNPPTGCVDEDGQQHAFGADWTRDCISCSCSTNGMSCCNQLPGVAEVYIPEECELVVNKQACTAKLVLKSDKTKHCIPT